MNVNTLAQNSILYFYHTAPLHYLVFYARTKQLLSKAELTKYGYGNSHFRSSSKNVDVKRGFGNLVHCTNNPFPPILLSKLNKGYQHMEICIPSNVLDEEKILLCKYNIAKNRGLFTESLSTGSCINGFKIPVASTVEEKVAMLTSISKDQHIEILIKNSVDIPDSSVFRFFSATDAEIANGYFTKFNVQWKVRFVNPIIQYNVKDIRKEEVNEFLLHAYEDESWRGNGLEFDR